jgi:hypothetical protein
VGAYGHHYGDCRRELWRVERCSAVVHYIEAYGKLIGFLIRLEFFAVYKQALLLPWCGFLLNCRPLVCAFCDKNILYDWGFQTQCGSDCFYFSRLFY